jgi:hypothetical protein
MGRYPSLKCRQLDREMGPRLATTIHSELKEITEKGVAKRRGDAGDAREV